MDYRIYRLSRKEKLRCTAFWILLSLLLSRLFYGCFPPGVLVLFGLPFLWKREERRKKKKRDTQLLLQFKELILSFSNNLKAGYSVENALREAYGELTYLYGKEEMIMVECRDMLSKIRNNHTIEEVFLDFGERSSLEDIRDFSQVFSVAKRSGGNLSAIIRDASERIAIKMTESEEIALLFESKRFEQKIMDLVPVLIMLYIGITSPGYFDPLYGNLRGIVLMTAALSVYAGAFFWAERIMQIEI